MSMDYVLQLGKDALLVTLLASAPMLLSGMLIGLLISVFQSVTQIQEITLTFVPKIVVVMGTFILFLPWISDILLEFVRRLFMDLNAAAWPG